MIIKLKKTIFVIVIIVYTFNVSIAQDDAYYQTNSTSENVNRVGKKNKSGYIFIDGKYVNPPYRFKIKDQTLYVNNQAIKSKKTNVQNRKKIKTPKQFPFYPEGLSKNDSIDSFLFTVEPTTGENFWTLSLNYFLSKYSYDDAVIKMLEYVTAAPNIKEYNDFTLVAENGEERKILLISTKYKSRINSNKDLKKTAKRTLRLTKGLYKEQLQENNILFLLPNNKPNRLILSQNDLQKLIVELYRFNTENYTYDKKSEVLKMYFNITDENIIKLIIENSCVPENIYNDFIK